MKSDNPLSIKLKQAIMKIRMKVRNKVQLPEKLKFSKVKAKKGGSHSVSVKKSRMQTSTIPAYLKDSIDTVTPSIDQYKQADIMNFYPPQVNFTDRSIASDSNKKHTLQSINTRDGFGRSPFSIDGNSSIDQPRTSKSTRAKQSPISLKGIINKLEQVEKDEKVQKSYQTSLIAANMAKRNNTAVSS